MSSKTIKRLASSLLKVGENKIHIDPETSIDAMTRADVLQLIKDKVITKKPKKGKARNKVDPKRTKGVGSRKGTKYSRKSKKEQWMLKVRSLRKLLSELIAKKEVDKKYKKKIYLQIKGNAFRGKRAMLNYLTEQKILKRDKNE